MKANPFAGAASAARLVSVAIRDLGTTLRALIAVTYQQACRAYRKENGRLPGSDRTARLRKKRRTIVLRWYVAHLEQTNP